jgi:ribosomal protein S18 acetylase RimI-like enzyme
MESAEIIAVEEAALAAWPALEIAQLDGWHLRAALGVTGRANSVWPNRCTGSLSLDERLEAVERFYTERGLAAKFQITPAALPEGLDARLRARGYRLHSPTWVQTASLGEIMQHTRPLRELPNFEIEVSEEFDVAWFILYREAEGADESSAAVRRVILQQLPQPSAFVSLSVDGAEAAVGLGVVCGSWMGVFCMSTVARFRRMGAASAILRSLAIWGSMHEADQAYLQVRQENAAAIATYARAGFTTAYPYHYRVLNR